MKLLLLQKLSFLLWQLTSAQPIECTAFKYEKEEMLKSNSVRSIDLTYESGCSANRDTLSYSYTLSFSTDSLRTMWVSQIQGFKAYQISLYDNNGVGLAFLSSQDIAIETAPPVQTTSKQILIKAWVIRDEKPQSCIILNWEE